MSKVRKNCLLPCVDCHEKISSSAKSCPHCGCSDPMLEKRLKGLMRKICLSIVIAIVLSFPIALWIWEGVFGQKDYKITFLLLISAIILVAVKSLSFYHKIKIGEVKALYRMSYDKTHDDYDDVMNEWDCFIGEWGKAILD